MTVFEALKALGADYNVPDEVIEIVLIGRGIDGSVEFTDLDNRTRSLLRLDLLLNIILFTPSSSSSQSVSHGGFQKTGSVSAAPKIDIDKLFKMYAAYDDDLYGHLRGRVIAMSNPYI